VITEKDLQEAIAECQGERNPNANTCIKLAAYLTIKDHLYPDAEPDELQLLPSRGYSFAPPPETVETVDFKSDSEFSRMVDGREAAEVWPIIEELVESVQMISPRLYNSFMEKLE